MHDLKVLQAEMKDTQQEVRNLTIMGMRPNLSPHKKALFLQMERSARAELKLRHRALEHAKQQQQASSRPNSTP